MSSFTDILPIYSNDPGGLSTLVIQNLGDNVREEDLQNYLEIICTDQEITDICYPCQGGGVAIAVLDTNLNDIKTFQEKASKRRFEGSILHLELLSEPDGIFIPDVPPGISEEYLNLYFENKKSGGEEETVQNVDIVDVGTTKNAVVDISSTGAINSILSKQTHQFRREAVKLQPYYKTVHGYIIEYRKERKEEGGSRLFDERRTSGNSVDSTNPVRTRQQLVRPLRNNPQQYDDEDTEGSSNTAAIEKALEKSDESQRSYGTDCVNNERFRCDDNERPRRDAESTSRQETANAAFKLKIISDDCDDQTASVNIEPRDQFVSASIGDDNFPFSTHSEEKHGSNKNKNRNVAAVKPVQRGVQRQLSNESREKNRKSRGGHGKRACASDLNDNKVPLNCQQEIQVSSVKINMLIIYRFQSKANSDTVNVEFKEGEGKVIIKGYSEDDVSEAKLRMHECLEQLVCATETLPRMKCVFLARGENRRCIRSRCIKQKIKAAFDVDVTKSVLRSYAFSKDEAEKGLQFFKDEITVKTVNLRPGQERLALENDWTTFIQGQDSSFTTIYLDENNKDSIIIESFMETKAKDIQRKIIQYLKQNVPKKTSEVMLESAKARCFKSCFEDSLKREVQKTRGKLNVEVQSNKPFKIRVCVEGEDSLTAELTKMVDQIWHEKIDFKKISDRDEDRWLIMKGLDGPYEKDFFPKFEKSHNCFIQISKDGEIKLPRPSVRTENAEENSETKVTGALMASKAINHQGNVTGMEQMFLDQAKWDDDEALELARAISINDMNRVSTDEVVEDEDISEPMFHRRQHSEGESNTHRQFRGRPHSDRLRRPTSSPDLHRHMSIQSVPQVKTESITMMHTRVTLMTGEIVRQSADVLVNIVSPSYNLTESIVSKAFVRRAGQEIFTLFNDARPTSNGTVVKTDSCGKLRCKSVMHVVLKKGQMYCQQMIRETIEEVLQECQANGYSSVMFPPLGVGRMCKYSPDIVAERMLVEIYRNLRNNTARLRQVTIVIFDDKTYAVFEKVFKSFDESSAKRNIAVPARPFAANIFQHFGQALLHQHQQQQQRPLGTQGQPQMCRIQQTKSQAPIARIPGGHDRANYKTDNQSEHDQHVVRNRRSHQRNYGNEQEQDNEYRGRQMSKEKRPSRHRFSERKPVPNLCVVVVAKDKDRCIQARNDLGKKIREDFLHEECIDKRQKISDQAKSKIVSIIEKRNIESVKGKQKYILKGHKESVIKARMDILEVLLGEKDMVEKTRKRKENTKRETKEFVRVMVEGEPEVPSYWSNYKSDVSLKSILTSIKRTVTGKNYEKHDLPSNSPAFRTIIAMINSTFDSTKIGKGQDAVGLGGYTQLRVLKIQRIENLELYDKFTSARQKLFLKLFKSGEVRFPKPQNVPGCTGPITTCQYLDSSLDKDLHTEINEVLLFHGTKKENVGTICTSGLDQRLGSGKAMFGPGIYGAETSTKADQYSDDKTSRSAGQGNHKRMFLMRMVLGNSYVCSDSNPHKYRRPPCTSCYKDDCREAKHAENNYGQHMFDSVIGDNGKLFREFVVYDSSLCYPEYIIEYERH